MADKKTAGKIPVYYRRGIGWECAHTDAKPFSPTTNLCDECKAAVKAGATIDGRDGESAPVSESPLFKDVMKK